MKKLALVALLIPSLVFAQSYPSPTYNNVTVGGSLNLSNISTPFRLNGSAGNVGDVLTSTGANSTPRWQTLIGGGTVTSVNVSGGTTGLTATGGPVTSSGTITLGGTLGYANGGTNAVTAAAAFNNLSPLTTTGDLVYESATGIASRLGIGSSGQVLTVTGGVPTWSAASGGLTPIAANSVLGNATASTAIPTAVSLPSCSSTNQALNWTASTGFTCQTIATSGSGTVTSVNVSGGTTGLTFSGGPVTTSGTITEAGTLGIANGGTNATTAATALSNLGGATSGANSNITSLSGLTTPLSTGQGGTNANTAAAAFNNLSPMTTTGDIEYEASAGTAARLPIGSANQVLTVVSGHPAWAAGGGGSSVINGYINGYTLANDATTPNTVLDVAAGYAADSTNATMITGTAFTKSISSTWAAGSGNGGMGTGLTVAASTWYHVFAIINNGAFDVYFDTSPTAANKPAGTTAFRYIGSFKTNASSNILAFTQYGQKFIWSALTADLNGGTATTQTPVTLSTPLGFVTFPMLRVSMAVSAANFNVNILEGTSSVLDGRVFGTVVSTTTEGQIQSVTNTASQVSYLTASASNSVQIFTVGYINPHVAPNW